MVARAPRDEREWRALVERQLRDASSGIRPLVNAAVGSIIVDIEENSTRHPTAPIELTYQTARYLNSEGNWRVRFMLDFPDVIHATDGTDIVVDQYELWGKPVSAQLLALTRDAVPGLAVPGLTLPGLAATPANRELAAIDRPWQLVSTNVESSFRADGFETGTLWDFRARAIGRGMAVPGEWSIVVQVQMLQDSTPPGQPSPPVLTVQRGTITATWDGQAVTGAMPADFRYAILAHGTDTSPTHEIARFGRGGGFKVVANIPYYDPQFFRLKAVDEAGNESPWSEQAVAYTTPLVDRDVILSTIDAAQTYLKNIDAGVSILPNTIITEHLVVTEEMTAAIANFLHVRADMMEVNEIWADAAWFGVADAILVRSDMFEGKAFTGGTFTGTLFQTDVEDLTGLKINAVGVRAWNPGGELTLNIDAFSGDVDILGTFQIGRLDEPYVLLDKNVWSIWPGIRFKVQDTLAYHPTQFAIGGDGSVWGWETGDFITLGSQLTANSTPRSEMVLGAKGRMVKIGREWAGTTANEIRFEDDGATSIRGYLKTSYVNSMWRTIDTPTTALAAGSYTVPVTPPPFGAYWPSVNPDGLAPVDFNTRNISASGFEIHFTGPASNSTSFHGLLVWRN